ncbi:MAG: hypothetical protein ABIM89_15120 [Mycobacteriales bacterium]
MRVTSSVAVRVEMTVNARDLSMCTALLELIAIEDRWLARR